MKKLLLATVGLLLAGIGAGTAAAAPSVTVCHDVRITVNDLHVSDAACNRAP